MAEEASGKKSKGNSHDGKKSPKRKLNEESEELPSHKYTKVETTSVGNKEKGHTDPPTKDKKKSKAKTERTLKQDCEIDSQFENSHKTEVPSEEGSSIQKKHKKKSKKKSRISEKNGSGDDNQTKEEGDEKKDVAKNAALLYLQKWQGDREHWSFQKVRQVWLLQNIYRSDLVPDTVFPVLMNYLDGLKGKARTLTVEKAEKIMDNYEEESDVDDENLESESCDKKSPEKVNCEQMERARQLIQRLSS